MRIFITTSMIFGTNNNTSINNDLFEQYNIKLEDTINNETITINELAYIYYNDQDQDNIAKYADYINNRPTHIKLHTPAPDIKSVLIFWAKIATKINFNSWKTFVENKQISNWKQMKKYYLYVSPEDFKCKNSINGLKLWYNIDNNTRNNLLHKKKYMISELKQLFYNKSLNPVPEIDVFEHINKLVITLILFVLIIPYDSLYRYLGFAI